MGRRVRKGDMVAIVAGDDKGKRGRVLRVLPDENRVIVEGVNLVYKHLRRSQQNPQGGRIRKEAPVHASNVMPIDTETNKPTRVRVKVSETGRRVRTTVHTGALLDAEAASRRGSKKESGGASAASGTGEE